MEKRKHIIKRADIILMTVIIVAAVLAFLIYRLNNSTPGQRAVISVDSVIIAELRLDKDTEYRINGVKGYNILVIQNGEVRILEADCPDKICVKHRPIYASGESITCLPNRVIVEIKGSDASELDGYTGR